VDAVSAELVRLLRGDVAPAGRGVSLIMGGWCTSWDAVTYENAVQVGETDYTNLPVLDVAGMGAGNVLVAFTAGGPVLLGQLHQPTPAP